MICHHSIRPLIFMMSGTGAEGSEEHVEPQVDRSWADLKDAPLQFDPDFDLVAFVAMMKMLCRMSKARVSLFLRGSLNPRHRRLKLRGDTILLIGHTLRGVHIASWADA